MEELAHRFLVAAQQRRDLGDPFATSAGQHHLAATHLYAIRRAQTGSQGRALLVGERTDKDGRSHTSQDTPFRPTFTEIALDTLERCQSVIFLMKDKKAAYRYRMTPGNPTRHVWQPTTVCGWFSCLGCGAVGVCSGCLA